MPFTVNYNLDKRPKQAFPDGREEYPEDEKRWAVFQLADQAREAAAAAPTTPDEADTAGPSAPEARSPKKVIDKLLAARGELDVILDLINSVEQQQFLSLAHVPQAKDPAALAQQASLLLARRKSQLRAVSDRLRSGIEAISAQSQVSDKFLNDLLELRKEWKLSRHRAGGGGGGAFFIDLSLPILSNVAKKGQGLNTIQQRLENAAMQINIVPAADGTACVAVSNPLSVRSNSSGGPVVIKGPAAISAELYRRQLMHAWRFIERIVSTNSGRESAVAFAVLQLAMKARKQAEQPVQVEDMDTMDDEMAVYDRTIAKKPRAQVGKAAEDLSSFMSTAGCKSHFEGRALRCFARLCQDARMPALVKEARGLIGESEVDSEAAFVESLAKWLHHAALCHAVDKSLTQQEQNLVHTSPSTKVAVKRQLVSSSHAELSSSWSVQVGGSTVGLLVAENGMLHWRGKQMTEIAGFQISRAQLDDLLERIVVSIGTA